MQNLRHVDLLYQDGLDTKICTLLYYDYVAMYTSYNTKDYHTVTRLRLKPTDLQLLAMYAHKDYEVG